MIARVAVEAGASTGENCYDYLVPDGMAGAAVAGARVAVPFGAGNRHINGVIVALSDTTDVTAPLKSLAAVDAGSPALPGELVELAVWMSGQYMCPIYDALRAMIPGALTYKFEFVYSAAEGDPGEDDELYDYIRANAPVAQKRLTQLFGSPDAALARLVRRGLVTRSQTERRGVGDRTVTLVSAAGNEAVARYLDAPSRASERHRDILEYLQSEGSCEKSELCYMTGATDAVLSTLKKHGVVVFEKKQVLRPAVRPRTELDTANTLTEAQARAADGIAATFGKYSVNLLYGVTGSGKTHVFFELIDRTLAAGRQVIVLVPEIMLAAQMTERLCARYGDMVAVAHSDLPAGARADEYFRMRTGLARIAVGTRTAVFAPFDNIGLIVIDEEQEHTYKSELSPRYSARAVACRRCESHGGTVVLASATPSLETYYMTRTGRFGCFELPGRFNNKASPPVHIVDLRDELRQGNASPISLQLTDELETNLSRGEQSILFINRRGYNSFVSCRACGYVVRCDACSIAMTYHKRNGRLMCHYCGHSLPAPSVCPECGSEHIRFFGTGTQKIEEELHRLFPKARVLRMDADTTARRGAHEDMLSAFARGDYDILLGTQMVTKGLDFPNVTLVGVLAADATLYGDDYRAAERTFSLLTQVIGRAGRSEKQGRAVIQTYSPDHDIITLATTQNYAGFYEHEMNVRKILLYPPYSDLCQIIFAADAAQEALDGADAFKAMLVKALEGTGLPCVGLGPSPCAVLKINNRYRYKLLLKCRNSAQMRALLRDVLNAFAADRAFRGTEAKVDFNPYNIQ